MFCNKNGYLKKKKINQMAVGNRLNGGETKGEKTSSLMHLL